MSPYTYKYIHSIRINKENLAVIEMTELFFRNGLPQRLQKLFPPRIKIGLEGGQQVAIDQGADA